MMKNNVFFRYRFNPYKLKLSFYALTLSLELFLKSDYSDNVLNLKVTWTQFAIIFGLISLANWLSFSLTFSYLSVVWIIKCFFVYLLLKIEYNGGIVKVVTKYYTGRVLIQAQNCSISSDFWDIVTEKHGFLIYSGSCHIANRLLFIKPVVASQNALLICFEPLMHSFSLTLFCQYW